MNESPPWSRDQIDTVVVALAPLSDDERKAYVTAHGWSAMMVFQSLKERSLALLLADPEEAAQLAEASIAVASLTDNPATHALASRGMAHALTVTGRYADAVDRYNTARADFKQCGAAWEAAVTLIGLVTPLMMLGRYDQALATAWMAREELSTQGDERRVAQVEANLGNVFHRLDRHDEALAAYERARAGLLCWGDTREVARVDWNRGNALAMLNQFDAALAAYGAAADTYKTFGCDAEWAQTSYNAAYLHFLRGHYGQALTAFARVRPLFERLADQRHLALCDLDEAEVMLALNRPIEAGDRAERAAASFDDLHLRYEAAKARAFQAVSLLDREDFLQAETLLDEAAALFGQEGNSLWVATVGLLVAELALRRGDARGAVARVQETLPLLEPLAVTARKGRAWVLRGQALRALGRLDAARADAQAACAYATALGDHVLSYQAFYLLARVQGDVGKIDDAAVSFERAADHVDWLRGGITRDDLRISFAADKVAFYEDAVRNALTRGRVGEAFEQVERAKARALVDLLAGEPAIRIRAEGDDARLAARVETLRAELTGLYNSIHGEGEGRYARAGGNNTLLARMQGYEAEMTSALATLEARQEPYVALRSAATARLAQVHDWLGTGEALLEYFFLGDDVIAFVITNTDVRLYGPLTTRRIVDDLLQRWRFHLAHFRHGAEFVRRHDASLRATTRAILGALYTCLIAPLIADLSGYALMIVPHGPLHHVPFHALYNGDAFLIERHEISYAPSATVLVRPRRPAAPVGPALILGVSDPSLPHVFAEVEAVAACHDNPVVLLGDRATGARFAAEATRCCRIHLATHAIFRADNPLFSAIQLADDWLTVSDIYNLDLAADLVVLSACDTGAGVVLHGDEVVGLTRGFLYAGARALVASLWAANDAATARLMASFYTAMAAGQSVRGALRTAQCAALACNPHPYYWGPFIVFGQEHNDRTL